jgi:hypothetical protein
MKLIENILDLKKGDCIIIKDNTYFASLGFSKVTGEVFLFDSDKENFSIKCKESNSIEKIKKDDGKIFLIS